MPEQKSASLGRRLGSIFLTTFRVGLFTFGGGLSMLPMMQHEFVERRGWVDDAHIADVFAVAQSLPGVLAVNTSVLLGYRMAGSLGSLVAALGSVLPSFLVLCVVSVFYNAFIANPYVAGAMRGLQGAVMALLLSALFGIRKVSLTDWFGWLLFPAALGAALFFPSLNVIYLLLGGGALGFLFYFRRLKREVKKRNDL